MGYFGSGALAHPSCYDASFPTREAIRTAYHHLGSWLMPNFELKCCDGGMTSWSSQNAEDCGTAAWGKLAQADDETCFLGNISKRRCVAKQGQFTS